MIIAGTGHRPNKLGGYSPEATRKLYNIAHTWLTDNKPSHVISGMALGWDMALANAAISCAIPFTAAIPFEGQESMWPKASQDFYNHLLSKANTIIDVCSPGYAAWKMQKRNEWMVDNCDTLLALWNGTNGGTANCVNYAIKMEKSIINLYDRFKLAHS